MSCSRRLTAAYFFMFEVIIKDFDLKNTFENGQCFRFNRYKDGYLGVAGQNVIYIVQDGEKFVVDGVSKNTFEQVFVKLFDLERDYAAITNGFKTEENLLKAIKYGKGMRIMAQDRWETLISFIISQNNNITRIKTIIERICIKYGTPIEFDNTVFYTFPTAEQLKNVTEADYAALGCGYRAKYLTAMVKTYLNKEIDLDKIADMEYSLAKKELTSYLGIGPKVADCILLFGLNFYSAFPIDTWIQKVMEALYLKKKSTKQEISACAIEQFGDYAGIAQQFLFYYARENKIKGL